MSDMSKVILYHGTHSGVLDEILRDGIKPRSGAGNYQEAISREGFVYLSKLRPLWYAMRAINASELDDNAIIFEVVLKDDNLNKLHPDEDFMAWKLTPPLSFVPSLDPRHSHIEEYRKADHRSKILKLAQTIDLRLYQHEWKNCIEVYGTACMDGHVSPKQIRRYAVIKPQECPHWVRTMYDTYYDPVARTKSMLEASMKLMFDGVPIPKSLIPSTMRREHLEREQKQHIKIVWTNYTSTQ